MNSEESKNKKKPVLRKLNFKIDETLEDVVPFSDIKDSQQFIEKIRQDHWHCPLPIHFKTLKEKSFL